MEMGIKRGDGKSSGSVLDYLHELTVFVFPRREADLRIGD